MRRALLLVGLLVLACRAKWRSFEEFDARALEGHTVRHPQDYDLEGAKRVAGAYLAQLARGGGGPFQPYTACVDPADARKPFRFLDDSFAPGWTESAARLEVEIQGGPRLTFCLDLMVVNTSRFPCFECPAEKYVSVAALDGMR